MAEGDIGAVIDTLEYDPQSGYTPHIIHIANDVYAIVGRGGATGLEGWIYTIGIHTNGQIDNTPIDTLQFEVGTSPNICGLPHITHIYGNVYAIVYGAGVSWALGRLRTVTIGSDGTIGAPIDIYQFDAAHCEDPRIIPISGNIYAIVYRGNALHGYIRTVTINNNGTIVAAIIDTLDFDVSCEFPKILHIAGDVYAIAYTGPGGDGWLLTVTIDNLGNIGAGAIDTLEFDPVSSLVISFIHVSGNTYAISYWMTPVDTGRVCTVDIDNAGNIGAAPINQVDFTGVVQTTCIIHTSSDFFAIAYGESPAGGRDGVLCTLTISPAGLMTLPLHDTYEFEAGSCYYPHIIYIGLDTYAIAYQGPDDDGWLKTVNIETWKAPSVQTLPATGVT